MLRRKPSHLRLACAGAAALATLWLGEVLRLVLVFATLGSELHWYRAAPPTASVEACFYAVYEAPQGAECASPMVYRRAARLAADARAASGPRGDQSRLLVSPERRRRGDSEDHTDSPEHLTTATTRDGLTLL